MGDRLKDGQWLGQPAHIIGGGPSLKGFDWTLLRNRPNIIAINRAFKDCPTADIWFSEDVRVLEVFTKDPAWKDFSGVKVLHGLDPSFVKRGLELEPSLFVIEKKREGKYWSRSIAEGLSYSSNSGVGAINLAQILGADPIYLLGFDCRSAGEKEENYHDTYEKSGFDRTGSAQYDSFRSEFEHWVDPHTRDRLIVNLINPAFESRLRCWPKSPIAEHFSRAEAMAQ